MGSAGVVEEKFSLPVGLGVVTKWVGPVESGKGVYYLSGLPAGV